MRMDHTKKRDRRTLKVTFGARYALYGTSSLPEFSLSAFMNAFGIICLLVT